MADIKTRRAEKGTIKTLDKASVAASRMKHSYARIKDQVEEKQKSTEGSPAEYAVNRLSGAGDTLMRKGGGKFNETGGKSVTDLKNEIRQRRQGIKDRGSDISRSSYIVRRPGAKIKKAGKSSNEISYSANKHALSKRFAEKRLTGKHVKYSGVRKGTVRVAHAVRAIATSLKTLFLFLFAGGWIAVLVVVICCLFGAALYFFGDSSSNDYLPVSAEVESYTPVIEKYAKEYEIPEYVELIKAVMMQESGGRGTDPMQASECSFNTKYPKKSNGITDPEYSISCGIQYLKSTLTVAGVQNPVDMDRIKLALQGYNFGVGYISWAFENHGGYSKAGAVEYSKQQAKKNGWSSYGDTDYAGHVLRYYPYGNYSYDVIFNGSGKLGLPIAGMTQGNITSHFGPRSSPGGIGSKYHQGTDIGFPTGTKVLACESGTVTSAGWNGGLGKCIIIRHSNSLETVYGHLSKINVSKGQKVVRGQVIGEVGNTGNSTGPHLHLGVRVNGSYVNPEKGWLSMEK